MQAYLREDEITPFQEPDFMMENQQCPPTSTHTLQEASLLYTMLPTIVQSRLPRLPSIRGSVNIYGLMGGRKSESSLYGADTPGSISSSSTMTLVGAQTSVSSDGESTESYYQEESLFSDEEIPLSLRSRPLQTVAITESKSGIVWKFANQGLISILPHVGTY